MRIAGKRVEHDDLNGCMKPTPDGDASPDVNGRERQRYRVLQIDSETHVGTYIGLKDGSLDGAFWMQVTPPRRLS